MSPGVPTKIIGACAGLTGLAVAVVAGLASDNRAESVLLRGIVAMLLCQIVGWIIGAIAERTIRDAIRGYQDSNPVNTSSTATAPPSVEKSPVRARAA